ncbi:MAG TPA: hypothetical protein VGL34_25755 [Steroidobacteraceae bacterium]
MNLINDQDLSMNERKRAQGGMLRRIDPPVGVVQRTDRIENADKEAAFVGAGGICKITIGRVSVPVALS